MCKQNEHTDPDMSGFELLIYMIKNLLIQSMIILPFVGLLLLIMLVVYGCHEIRELNGMGP